MAYAAMEGVEAVGSEIQVTSQEAASGEPLAEPHELTITFSGNSTALSNRRSHSTLRLPKPSDEAGLPVLHFFQEPGGWRPVPDQRYEDNVLTAVIHHYGHYQVFASAPSKPYSFGDVYVFPNPTKNGEIPTLHIEAERADKLTTRIYDISGNLVFETRIDLTPSFIDGKSAYELPLDAALFRSGVYIGLVTAEKAGKEVIRKKYRFTVVK